MNNAHVSLTSVFYTTMATLNKHWPKLFTLVFGQSLLMFMLQNSKILTTSNSLVPPIVIASALFLYVVFFYSFFIQTAHYNRYIFSGTEYVSLAGSFFLLMLTYVFGSMLVVSPLIVVHFVGQMALSAFVKNSIYVLLFGLTFFFAYCAAPYTILSIPALFDRQKGVQDAMITSKTYVRSHGALFLKVIGLIVVYVICYTLAALLFAKANQVSYIQALAGHHLWNFTNIFILFVAPFISLFWITFYMHLYLDIKKEYFHDRVNHHNDHA